MSVIHTLCTWNERWTVLSGVVHCRRCRNSQFESDRTNSFRHIAGCLYATYDSPWHDLEAIAVRIQLQYPDAALPVQMKAPSHDCKAQ